ncbi:MarR family transcriptional regulator [Pseudogracilibacillus auburnensis]|uniref:MarR family transcriptional regulator n=1 Tax=Pseudogracilibacillus auburnensis TaxID=1494959 RepID=A0A2V3VLG2_9BACI|nr:MarR family transcriptional regulator [Pseudogracilibacillus auburnensis]MBO1004269.1 MarR family transcriptional regulator [Pseudogracilibacillus auburnensis]PXW82390.1 MarR family transcriptional regulator [Pseudogracilibacillus auburnensis]
MSKNFLNDTVQQINDLTHFINNQVYQKHNTLIDENITAAQDHLIHTIHTAKTMTINEIAQKLNVSSSAVSQQVSKLEENGYVKRQINVNNRREILVSLDKKGHSFIKQQDKFDEIVTEKLYKKLGEKKLIEFKNILLTLKEIAIKEFP